MLMGDAVEVYDVVAYSTRWLIHRIPSDFRICVRCGDLAFAHVGGRCAYSPIVAQYEGTTAVHQLGDEIAFRCIHEETYHFKTYPSFEELERDYTAHGERA